MGTVLEKKVISAGVFGIGMKVTLKQIFELGPKEGVGVFQIGKGR